MGERVRNEREKSKRRADANPHSNEKQGFLRRTKEATKDVLCLPRPFGRDLVDGVNTVQADGAISAKAPSLERVQAFGVAATRRKESHVDRGATRSPDEDESQDACAYAFVGRTGTSLRHGASCLALRPSPAPVPQSLASPAVLLALLSARAHVMVVDFTAITSFMEGQVS